MTTTDGARNTGRMPDQPALSIQSFLEDNNSKDNFWTYVELLGSAAAVKLTWIPECNPFRGNHRKTAAVWHVKKYIIKGNSYRSCGV